MYCSVFTSILVEQLWCFVIVWSTRRRYRARGQARRGAVLCPRGRLPGWTGRLREVPWKEGMKTNLISPWFFIGDHDRGSNFPVQYSLAKSKSQLRDYNDFVQQWLHGKWLFVYNLLLLYAWFSLGVQNLWQVSIYFQSIFWSDICQISRKNNDIW